MGCIAQVRCVLVLRCGLAVVVWYPYAGWGTNVWWNDETLQQVSQFTYLGCSISYQFSNHVEFKLANFLQLTGTIKRTIFQKVRTETILKIFENILWVVLLWFDVCWCYVVVWLGWCGIRMRAEVLVPQLYCSGSMCVGVTLWFGWGGMVSVCGLRH